MVKNKLEEVLQNLLDTFGLETLLEQNDVTDLEVVQMLYDGGFLDLADYFYDDIDLEDEEDILIPETDDILDLFSYWEDEEN